MAAVSKIGKCLETIVAAITSLSGVTWADAPRAVWFPDFDREDFTGLTAIVLPVESESQPHSRSAQPRQMPSVHIAVLKPRLSADTFDSGDAVVNVAEKIVETFHKRRVSGASRSIVCTDARLEPVVSAEQAKQLNLWCSYIKLELDA